MNRHFKIISFFRDIFYSTIYQKLLNEEFLIENDQLQLSKIIALIAQIKYGDFNAESVPEYSTLLCSVKWSIDLQKSVETQHLNFDMISSSEAKIQFIKIFSEEQNYGMDTFHVTSLTDHHHQHLILGVRHDGLRVYQLKEGSPEQLDKLVQL